MKLMKLFSSAAVACLLAGFLPGSANAGLPEIIIDYCAEIVEGAEEGGDELSEATNDLQDCYPEFNDCISGFFGRGPVECIGKYSQCINRGENDVGQACNDFLREFQGDTRRAERAARKERVKDEFQNWFYNGPGNEECLAPSLGVAALCAGFASD
jgi:hypothetical protein